MAEYPREITQRFHGTPEQNAIALVGERPARWDRIVIEDYDPAWVGRFAAARSLLEAALGGGPKVEAMIESGLDRAVSFSLDRLAQRYVELYEKAIDR